MGIPLKLWGLLPPLHNCLLSTPSSTLMDDFSLNEHPVANEFLSLITCCQMKCLSVGFPFFFFLICHLAALISVGYHHWL